MIPFLPFIALTYVEMFPCHMRNKGKSVNCRKIAIICNKSADFVWRRFAQCLVIRLSSTHIHINRGTKLRVIGLIIVQKYLEGLINLY